MHYFRTHAATDFSLPDLKTKLVGAVLFLIPRASPDFEPIYPSVRSWYVELDDSDQAVREIGLDDHGRAVCASPWGRNLGFWTDLNGPFPDVERTPISQSVFEEAWQSFAEQTSVPEAD